jgi:hypothetical protein
VNRPRPRDSAPYGRAVALPRPASGAVPSWPAYGPDRRARPAPAAATRNGRAPAGARPRAPSPGLPAQVHLGGQRREPGRPRLAAAVTPASWRPETSAPCCSSSVSAPIAKVTVPRTVSGHGSGSAGSQPAMRTKDPATTAQTCTFDDGLPLPGSPAGLACISTSPPEAAGQCAGRNKAVNSPPRRGSAAVTCGYAPAAEAGRPARDSTPAFSSRAPSAGISHPGELPEPEGSGVMPMLLLPYGQSAVPRPGSRPRRPALFSGPRARPRRSRRAARPDWPAAAARTWRRPVTADLTPRGELSVDAAGPGRKASRTSRPARSTTSAARGGRPAPPAAARDPRRRHPHRARRLTSRLPRR